jgi:large subunit ribosomal protein L3
MLDTIIGFKQKMGAVYVGDRRYTVTWVKVDPCVVTQIKHMEKDGYMAVQLGTGSRRIKNITKPLQGHLKITQNAKVKSQNTASRYLREIRIKEESDLKEGESVKLTDVLKKGDVVTVTGISKGKGFAGVVKRYNFAGGPKTHGQSDRERAPGSIGQRTTPGRVYKGKRMAGRMGGDRVTMKNLMIVDVDEKNNLVAISGPVPGIIDGLVFVRKTGEGSVFVQDSNNTKEVKVEDGEEEVESAENEEKVKEELKDTENTEKIRDSVKKDEDTK